MRQLVGGQPYLGPSPRNTRYGLANQRELSLGYNDVLIAYLHPPLHPLLISTAYAVSRCALPPSVPP